MMIKEDELDTPEREYKIHWHGRFLRSYTTAAEFRSGLRFFRGFLICITGEYRGESIGLNII